MQIDIKGKDSNTLLALYNQEVEILKAKLLNGESWESLQTHRRNITTLSIVLQKNGIHVPQGNPAEFPQSEMDTAGPVD